MRWTSLQTLRKSIPTRTIEVHFVRARRLLQELDHSRAGDARLNNGGSMHHKRGRRKNARAGCLLCKMHKANGSKGMRWAQTYQELKARESEKEQREARG